MTKQRWGAIRAGGGVKRTHGSVAGARPPGDVGDGSTVRLCAGCSALLVLWCVSSAALVSPAGAGDRVYLGSRDAAQVLVLDGDTNSIVSTIPLPSLPHALAATPDGRRVFVFFADSSLGSIRTDADVLEGTVLLSGGRRAFAFSQDSQRVYIATVASPCSIERCGLVDVVDVHHLRVIATAAIPNPPRGPLRIPCDLAATPDGTRVLVMQNDGVFVSPLDTSTLQFGSPLVLPCCPICQIRANPQGAYFHVVYGDVGFYNFYSCEVESLVCRNPIPFQGGPGYFVVSPDGTDAYLPIVTGPPAYELRLLTLDIPQGSLAATLELPTEVPGLSVAAVLALSADASRAYVATANPDALLVIDTASNRIVSTLPLGVGSFTLSSDGTRAYAAGPDSLFVIDTGSNQVIATLPLAVGGMAVVPGFTSTPGPTATMTPTGTPSTVPGTGGSGCSVAVANGDEDSVAPFLLGGLMLFVIRRVAVRAAHRDVTSPRDSCCGWGKVRALQPHEDGWRPGS